MRSKRPNIQKSFDKYFAMNNKTKEILRTLIKQTEDNLAALKALLVDEDDNDVVVSSTSTVSETSSDAKKETPTTINKSLKKNSDKKMRIVSQEDLLKAFNIDESELEKDEYAQIIDVNESYDSVQQETVEEIAALAEKPKSTTPKKRISAKKVASVNYKDYSIDISETKDVADNDDEEKLGREILKVLDMETNQCSVIRLQKKYYDNGCEKLFIDKWHVVVTLLNCNMEIIDEKTVLWKTLLPFHYQLKARGIERHSVSDDPHKNWLPNTINLDLG